MATIVTRAGKGSPLTNTEVDTNFTNLNNDKIQSGDTVASLDINGGTIDGVTIGGSSAGAITGTTITGTSFVTSGNMTFGDNDKAIFGAGSDLEIYHNGSHSFISDVGTGRLYLQGTDGVRVTNESAVNMISAISGDGVYSYYNGSLKLATTSTGIDVTGTVTADGLTVSTATGSSSVTPTDIIIKTETNASDWSTTNEWGRLVFYSDDISNGGAKPHATIGTSATAAGGGLSNLVFKTSNSTPSLVKRMDINEGGDISFYEDTGTNARIFYDASTQFVVNEDSADFDFRVESDTNTHMLFVDAGNSRVVIGSSQLGVSVSPLQATNLAITDEGNSHHILIGNQNSDGTNKPGIIQGVNGTVNLGWGNSWTSSVGGTLTNAFSVSGVSGQVVVNENSADIDFRVESDTNTHALFVDAGNGRIGINESAPDATFHLSNSQASSASQGMILEGTWPWLKFLDTELNQNTFSIYNDSALYFTRLAYADRNNAPNGGVDSLILYETQTVFNEDSADIDFRVESNNNSHMLFVDAGLNAVGINASAPSGMFTVNLTGTANITNNTQTKVTDYAAASRMGFTGRTNNNDGVYFGMEAIPAGIGFMREASGWNTQMRFYTNNITSGPDGINAMQEKMRIESSAIVINETGADQDFRVESDALTHALFVDASTNKVGVGTNSPGTNNSASFGLTVGDGTGSAAVQLNVNGGGGNFGAVDGVNSPNQGFRSGHLNGTNRYEVSVNNNNSYAAGVVLSAGGTSWGTFSDERRKTDLVEIADGLNKVATLRAVTGRYNYDADDVRRPMLIAQDVQAVLPEAVGAMTASMDDPTEYLTLNYTETIPLLVSALKDAKTIIETLEARITALENA